MKDKKPQPEKIRGKLIVGGKSLVIGSIKPRKGDSRKAIEQVIKKSLFPTYNR